MRVNISFGMFEHEAGMQASVCVVQDPNGIELDYEQIKKLSADYDWIVVKESGDGFMKWTRISKEENSK